QRARLSKYFLQILAGATNANVILDPHGELPIGAEHRIPFWVTEADIGLDVYLLTPAPYAIDFQLETPDGSRISPPSIGVGNVDYVLGSRFSYYRAALPVLPTDSAGTHSGLWFASLRIVGGPRFTHITPGASGLPYDLIVHCQSNLNFTTGLTQSSYEVGAIATINASLNEYDVPISGKPTVWAEITLPDGSNTSLGLPRTDPGQFGATFPCNTSGLYTARVRARGTTLYGSTFDREQTLTASVYPGGGNADGTGGPRDDGTADGHPGSERPSGLSDPFWCQLVHCL